MFALIQSENHASNKPESLLTSIRKNVCLDFMKRVLNIFTLQSTCSVP